MDNDEYVVFENLDKKQIAILSDMFDENILIEQFTSPKLPHLQKMNFSEKQARDIIQCFFNLYSGIDVPDLVKDDIKKLKLSNDIKKNIIELFDELCSTVSTEEIAIAKKGSSLLRYGHDHIHEFSAVLELRPITQDNKLKKMLPSIVCTGEIQNYNHTKTKYLNFQIDVFQFEELVSDMNEILKEIKHDIKVLKDKGDPIVG